VSPPNAGPPTSPESPQSPLGCRRIRCCPAPTRSIRSPMRSSTSAALERMAP
jgi:hypothetical protein